MPVLKILLESAAFAKLSRVAKLVLTIASAGSIVLLHYAGLMAPIPLEFTHLFGSHLLQHVTFDILIISAFAGMLLRQANLNLDTETTGDELRNLHYRITMGVSLDTKPIWPRRHATKIHYGIALTGFSYLSYQYISYASPIVILYPLLACTVVILGAAFTRAPYIAGDDNNLERFKAYFTKQMAIDDPAHYAQMAMVVACLLSLGLGYARASHLMNRPPIIVKLDNNLQKLRVFEINEQGILIYEGRTFTALQSDGTLIAKAPRRNWPGLNWALYPDWRPLEDSNPEPAD